MLKGKANILARFWCSCRRRQPVGEKQQLLFQIFAQNAIDVFQIFAQDAIDVLQICAQDAIDVSTNSQFLEFPISKIKNYERFNNY